jgi:predicted AAA+ superfamily ATPase
MERQIIEQLVAWKNKTKRKPLILRGARQVGKTWLMKRFAETRYKDFLYLSFDENAGLAGVFEPDLNPRRIIRDLELLYQKKITAKNTLLIFDEIQESPRALKSLKYFNEEAPEYQIVSAGSLLGIALHPGTSFPVGKVEFLDIRPLSYREFLLALQQKNCCELLDEGDPARLGILKYEYIDLLKKYFLVGGMPEAVAAFAESGSISRVRQIQQNIVDMYDQDFSKHAPGVQVPKIRMLWNSIPNQLARENKKFVFGALSGGARAREYETAMLWILDTGIVHRVNRVADVKYPLKAYEDKKAFKLYAGDIGLLSCQSGFEGEAIFEGDRPFVEFKGALAEQYVLQELIQGGWTPFYWSSDKARSEVDFLIQAGGKLIPIEVKAGTNLRAKSLRVYTEKFEPPVAVRTSPADYKAANRIIDLPLYALGLLPNILVNNS